MDNPLGELVITQMSSVSERLNVKAFNSKESLYKRPLKEIYLCERLCQDLSKLMDIEPNTEIPSVKHEQSMFSWACDRSNLEIPKEFYDELTTGEIVEIYDLTGKALFKNLFFFQFSSYTLEDHATMSFFELFSRPSEIEEKIGALMGSMIENQDYTPKKSPLPVHLLKERMTKDKVIFQIDVRCTQLMRDKESNQPKAIAVRTKVKEYPMDMLGN